MALIGLKIPAEISRLFANVDVPGTRDTSDHLTMFHMSDDLDPKDIAKICAAVPAIMEKFKPFEAVVKKITTFPDGDDGVPIIGEVISKEMMDLRKRLAKVLDKEKIDYSKNHKDFKPHITLSYHDDKIKNVKLPTPFKWLVTELVLWGSNKNVGGDNGITVTFPLYDKASSADTALTLATAFEKLAHAYA